MAFRNNLADVRLIMNCLDSIKKVKSTNIIWHLPGQKFWISAIYCSAIGHIKLFCKRDKFPHSLRLKFRAPDSRRSYIVELEIWVPALSTRHSALITQHPALSTHHSAPGTTKRHTNKPVNTRLSGSLRLLSNLCVKNFYYHNLVLCKPEP